MKLALLTIFALAVLGSTSFADDQASKKEGQADFSSVSALPASVQPSEWPSKDNFSAGAHKADLDLIDSVLPGTDAVQARTQNAN